MVEVSPALRREQWKKLRCQSLPNSNNADGEVVPPPSKHTSDPESLGSTSSATSEDTEGAEVESSPLEGVSGFGNVEVRTMMWVNHNVGVGYYMHMHLNIQRVVTLMALTISIHLESFL